MLADRLLLAEFVPLHHIAPPDWLPPEEFRVRSCPLALDWPLLLELAQLIWSASLSPRLEDVLPLLDCPLLDKRSLRSTQFAELCPEEELPLLLELVLFWLNTHVPLLS